ncbi:PSP proline-rich domain-containing protein [Tieghemostelium lacteum]|uniref:PSP proline-rich domain-containing protein n=1 Tax=Tieghemostelium lacteum TaxID=361077 RepID=A0A151ZC70_TIELA|nr:PSP proline-rich domain-containing protein [Tieghemostelium lacteum]|eukprot:KYQ91547.1 PSP proline-rich domain-containing protein [Tieghemostelium lacteum]
MESDKVELNSNSNGTNVNKKKLKFQKKKEQKKKQKLKKILESKTSTNGNHIHSNGNGSVEKKYESDDIGFKLDENDPTFDFYSKLLNHFDGNDQEQSQQQQQSTDTIDKSEKDNEKSNEIENTDNKTSENGDDSKPTEKDKEKKLSNKERKRQQRANLPVLKQLVDRPDVVELHDVNSPNPGLLIGLKSTRNTISVPAHWCQKRKYLQGKRGYVKPPFELPSFIAATGISKIRDAILQKEQKKSSKQKQRERLQPKMRSMDIDYEVLRDAFFIHQTKPKLSVIGDLYYEGKEFEVSIKNKKPGQLSQELKRALGMQDNSPPPWLIYMQSFGPPPSYPNLKVPGVNAPIPEGAQYGTHIGGWGKPLLNEFGKPLFEAYTSQQTNVVTMNDNGEEIVREYWGELIPEEEVEEEEEEEDQQQDDQENQQDGNSLEEMDQSNDGQSSVPSGLETPDLIDIRKHRMNMDPNGPKQLYQVLEQQNVNNNNNSGFMESTHRYQIPQVIRNSTSQSSARGGGATGNRVDIIKSHRTGPVDINFNPSELENLNEISEDLIKKKYEQAVAATQDNYRNKQSKDDYSDLIEEQSKKRKQQLQKEQDKLKKFKF